MPVQYLKETPSQTGGPYVHIGCLPAFAGLNRRTQEKLHVLAGGGVPGEQIRIEGVVWDGSGHPLRDVMLELWQADSTGAYNAPGDTSGFRGWGRVGADAETGLWAFETIRPGATPWVDGRPQAPHCSLLLFARGINIHLHTRIYFDDRADANAVDPALLSIELADRRQTLIATRQPGDGIPTFRFDVHLQGAQETVFFDC